SHRGAGSGPFRRGTLVPDGSSPRAPGWRWMGMASKWVRVLAAFIVGAATLVIGLAAAGNLDTTANPDTGLVAGSNSFMLVLALALLLGFIAYAVVEYAQTRRLDSIARQFDTRTIVLMPIAIAI